MRILIILSLFLTSFLSYSATTISSNSLYGIEGQMWAAGPYNSEYNGWPCGQYAGNVYCYSMSTYELNNWCITYPQYGAPWGNMPACNRIKNGGIRQGYPLISDFQSGAVYDKSSSCEIRITVSSSLGQFYGNGGLVGFTQSSNSITSGNSRSYLADFRATFSDCRKAVMELGTKYGYGSNWNYKTQLYTGNPGIANLCIYVDNQNIGCNGSSISTVPPEPAVCNVNVPLTLDYGVVNSKEINGNKKDISIDYQCNKSATVSFSLLGGTPNSSGITLAMGNGLTSELCFLSGTSCPSSGGQNIKMSGKNGVVKLLSTLKGSNVSGGEYSSYVTVVSAFY
ncbi:hypothetical protein NVI2019_PEGOAJLN_00113 [Providencia alcalifaciens]|uniref:MrpH family fimbial adhesin n=1 Tax=Providencia TaxID=586 RepID=UPI000451BD99|nr:MULTISPECIES: hypothetical protein [Providencia]EUD05079.1 fimbrial protein [Providencia alcalifaciens RIMD 1656011]QLQ97661.1 hypothetical protein H0910_00745 [Providencia alcalifaciens]CAG9406726.1 hypothetical protein NVI2019_PEGOAJLN_00113 [Providencia alcalifaciens]